MKRTQRTLPESSSDSPSSDHRAALRSRWFLFILLLASLAGSVFLAFFLTRQTDFWVIREIRPAAGADLAEVPGAADTLAAASFAYTLPEIFQGVGQEVFFPLEKGMVGNSDCRIHVAPGVRVMLSILDKGRLYVEAPSNSRARIRLFVRQQDWWRLDEGRAWLIGSDDNVGSDRELERLRFDLAVDREEITAGGFLSLQLRPYNPEYIDRIGGALGDALLLFVPPDGGVDTRGASGAPGEDGVSGDSGEGGASAGGSIESDARGEPMIAFAGIDCALTAGDQRLAIWSFGHKGSWYMRSWRIPLKKFTSDRAALAFLARRARPFPATAYPPVPWDWRQRWEAKRDAIMAENNPARDWARLVKIYTNAVRLALPSRSGDNTPRFVPGLGVMPELREPLIIPMARYDMVSSPYGIVRYITSSSGSAHRGVDFASPEGVAVRTPWPGEVVFAGSTPTSGNMLVVHHGMGIFSSFMHLSAFRAEPGAADKPTLLGAGATVGLVGTTGLSTGPHLHYELRMGNCAIDSTPYFVRSPFARDPNWKTLPW